MKDEAPHPAFFGPIPGVCQPNVNAAVFPWLEYGGDDAGGGERAADPLHCAGIDSEPSGDDAHTGPPGSRQGFTDSFFECGGNRGPPKAFTLIPGARKPGTDSFRNHRSLEFGKDA
jgi:hypothetical protein